MSPVIGRPFPSRLNVLSPRCTGRREATPERIAECWGEGESVLLIQVSDSRGERLYAEAEAVVQKRAKGKK